MYLKSVPFPTSSIFLSLQHFWFLNGQLFSKSRTAGVNGHVSEVKLDSLSDVHQFIMFKILL